MSKLTKKEIAAYNAHSISVTIDGARIVSPIGDIMPVLKDGNTKTGKTVKTFSLLPTNKAFNTCFGTIPGTCPYHCEKCYATRGKYNCDNVINSNAINTILARDYMDFLDRAIRAQLDTLPGVDIRIHAAGDFFNKAYAEMWRGIVRDYPTNKFWTYTKTEYENTFAGLENGNIVKSLLPGIGFNFGHIEYVLRAYVELVARGETPYICRCTFDKNQHCENCKGCIDNLYVLFVEHSTEYKAEKDPLFPAACAIVDMQKDHTPQEIATEIEKILR